MVLEVLTGVLVAVTGIYAYFTFRILNSNQRAVEAMRSQTEALTRPYVTVTPFIPPKTPMLYLRISNSGKTSAEKLLLRIDRDFYQYGERDLPERNLANMSAFREPIETFPPGAELVFGLVQGFVLFGEQADPAVTPIAFSVSATYTYARKRVNETTTVDLQPYRASVPQPAPLIDQLEGIRKALERGATE